MDMFNMEKLFELHSEEDFQKAAAFIRSLPKSAQKLIIDQLLERKRANRSHFSQVNWHGVDKFFFGGIISAGSVSGR